MNNLLDALILWIHYKIFKGKANWATRRIIRWKQARNERLEEMGKYKP